MFLVSYMPTLTDCSCVHPFSECWSSHFSEEPWQPSHCTPSAMSNLGPRSSGLTLTAWQLRQRSLVSGLPSLRLLAIFEGLMVDFALSLVSAV